MARGSVASRTLANGKTVFDVRFRSSNGRQVQKRGFARKKDAEAYLTDQLALVHRGKLIVTDVRFAAYFDDWLTGHRARLEPGTHADYANHGRLRLKPYFGSMKLTHISQQDVRAYVAHHAAEGRLSVKTINNSLIVLGVALAHAVDDGLLSTNPAQSRRGARDRIRLPEPHREMDYLRLEEIPIYLAACDRTYRPLAEVLIATGLRIGEALALEWRDVDLDARRIRVLRSAKASGVGSTKSDRARAVDLGPRIESVLRDRHDYQALWMTVQPGTPVFARRDGTVVDRTHVSRYAHKRALRHAGLRTTLRLHDLRHTAAAAWLSAGLPLLYVQRQLGHASLTTTESIYAHLEDGVFAGASATVEQTIWHRARPRAA